MRFETATGIDYKHETIWVDSPEDITEPEFRVVFGFAYPITRPYLLWTREDIERGKTPGEFLHWWNRALNLNPSSSSIAPFFVVKATPGITHGIVAGPFMAIEWKSPLSGEMWREELNSATTHTEYPEEIRLILSDLLARAREETFEDGMESQFSKALISYIKRYGNAAVKVLTEYILSEHVNAEIASEALRWIGHIEDASTYESRLWLLGRGLLSASSRIRDAALLGLAFLNDPQAIPLLEAAIQRERIQELREDMKQALEDLRCTPLCR